MLKELLIRNIILIDKLELSFSSGFCVLTGETGAGKSILLGALSFVLGKRASSSLIRNGADQGSVTAVFDIESDKISDLLSEYAIEYENEITIRRVIYADGKGKAFINDTPVNISLLASIAENLVEIHGQHDQKGLMDASSHISIIDSYGKLESHLKKVSSSFKEYKSTELKINEMLKTKNQAIAEEDYLRHIYGELEKINPQGNEELELAERRSFLMNKEKITSAIADSLDAMQHGSPEKSIRAAQSSLFGQEENNDAIEAIIEGLERAIIEINEANAALEQVVVDIDDGEGNLDEVEQRLFALRNLARKHNVTVDGLLEFKQQVADKISLLESSEYDFEQLKIKLEQTRKLYCSEADILSKKRREASLRLEKEIASELAPLKMGSTQFIADFETRDEENWTESGIDKVRFLASTNAGNKPAPLAKIASGGELSRFMLAFKVVLSNVKSVPTMIFDEVDTGIGGAVADSVGRRLEMLGKKQQVFSVTHQPQVAARGSSHFKVEKLQQNDVTTTSVRRLTNEQRSQELARMLAGEDITKEAIAAADKLLEAV